MPISKTRRPEYLMSGTVIAIEAKAEYKDNVKTGNVERYDVTVLQANHATPEVRFPITGPNVLKVPERGETVVLIVSNGETREYGANLRAERYATVEDLDGYAAQLLELAAA